MVITLIGCASHRFNLAVEHWIKTNAKYVEIIHKMHACMIQLWHLNNGAQLWLLTDLFPVNNNVKQKAESITRGSNIFDWSTASKQLLNLRNISEFPMSGESWES